MAGSAGASVYAASPKPAWASSQHGGWVLRAKALPGGGRGTRHLRTQSHGVVSAVLCWLGQTQRPTQVQGEVHGLHPLVERARRYEGACRCSRTEGNAVAAIWRKEPPPHTSSRHPSTKTTSRSLPPKPASPRSPSTVPMVYGDFPKWQFTKLLVKTKPYLLFITYIIRTVLPSPSTQ